MYSLPLPSQPKPAKKPQQAVPRNRRLTEKGKGLPVSYSGNRMPTRFWALHICIICGRSYVIYFLNINNSDFQEGNLFEYGHPSVTTLAFSSAHPFFLPRNSGHMSKGTDIFPADDVYPLPLRLPWRRSWTAGLHPHLWSFGSAFLSAWRDAHCAKYHPHVHLFPVQLHEYRDGPYRLSSSHVYLVFSIRSSLFRSTASAAKSVNNIMGQLGYCVSEYALPQY